MEILTAIAAVEEVSLQEAMRLCALCPRDQNDAAIKGVGSCGKDDKKPNAFLSAACVLACPSTMS